MICKICSEKSILFSVARVLGKYDVKYFRCENCNAVQTEEPFWIEEAYTSAITRTDLGMVSRNIYLSQVSSSIIISFFNQNKRFLDYGGGYGLFVRLMRDRGFNFFRYDKYSENLFAQGFDIDLENDEKYELITAFEVFEHLVNPLVSIEEMLTISENILFSTVLLPKNNPKPGQWWYYGLEHGQHVVFYTAKSLAMIAERFHLNLFSKNNEIHLLTKKRISPMLFNIISSRQLGCWLDLFGKKRSLLESDYMKVAEMIKLLES